MSFMSNSKINICLLVFSLCFALVFAELSLRAFDYPPHEVAGWKNQYYPDNQINQLGFRGQKIDYDDDDFVVVLLGDSYVSSGSSPFDSMPEKILEHLLRISGAKVKVFTLGTDGYGQDQEFPGAPGQRPDIRYG